MTAETQTGGGLGSRLGRIGAVVRDGLAALSPLRALDVVAHAVDLAHTVVMAREAPVAPTPKDVVWRKNKAQLYRYRRSTPATRKTPIFCVMPLINRAYILDLRPGASFVEYLLSQGHEVFLLDWGCPGDEDRGIDLTVLLTQYLPRAARTASRLTGGPLTVLGYCIGGALATCFAALHRGDLIKNLLLMTTPIDFADAGTFGTWTETGVFPLQQLTDTFPTVPSTFPDVGSKMLAPLASSVGQYAALEKKLRDPKFDVRGWQALYRWVNDGVPFPSAAYRQWIGEFYQGNKLVKGTLEIAGTPVRLENIRCPVLNVVASHDPIAPRSTTGTLLKRVGSTDTEELMVKGGHVGIVVGRGASTDLWPRVGAWLLAHDA